MRLSLEADKYVWHVKEKIKLRCIVLNDSYEPISIDKTLLVGPNVIPEIHSGVTFPISIEPASSNEKENTINLNPWCLYGRERIYEDLPLGKTIIYGYMLIRPTTQLLPKGPMEEENISASADPLELSII